MVRPMEVANRIHAKLTDALAPTDLHVVDDSGKHVGHAGHDSRGESHFTVVVVSDAFDGLSRVARQRLVYDLLAEELADRVHALSLKTLTPAEAGKE